MDRNQLKDELLTLAREEGLVVDPAGDLEQAEHQLRNLVHQIAADGLEQQLNQSKPGYEGARRVCPECGASQRFIQHRPKQVLTLLGPITVKRAYYRCDHCGQGSLPWDEQMGLGRRLCSVAVAKAATRCTAHEPFGQASTMLHELAGLRLSDSTLHELTGQVGEVASEMEKPEAPGNVEAEASPARHYTAVDGVFVHIEGGWREVRSAICYREQEAGQDSDQREACYAARYDSAEAFTPYVEALARRSGHHAASEKVLLGDGAKWIWQRIGETLSPQTVHITDWYHVMEKVWECAHALHGEDNAAANAFVKPIEALLWEGRLRELRDRMDRLLEAQPADSANRRAVETLRTYLRNQNQRLAYDDFRAAGYDIGSGRVEASCKSVVGQRAKRSGMQWKGPGFQATLSLRCIQLNNQSPQLWARQPLRPRQPLRNQPTKSTY